MLDVNVLVGTVPLRTTTVPVDLLLGDHLYVLVVDILGVLGGVKVHGDVLVVVVVVLFQELVVEDVQRRRGRRAVNRRWGRELAAFVARQGPVGFYPRKNVEKLNRNRRHSSESGFVDFGNGEIYKISGKIGNTM